jgi:hypothetical protein
MQSDEFDRITHTLGTMGTRRGLLRTAGMLGALLGGAGRWLPSRAAAAAPPPPASLRETWPVCSEERAHYCVDTFHVAGEDQLAGPSPAYQAYVFGVNEVLASNPDNPDAIPATHIYWVLDAAGLNLAEDDLTREIVLRVRVGTLKPFYTAAYARGLRLQVDGSAATGWTVDIRGRPALETLPDPPPADQEQATIVRVVFSGEAYTRADFPADFIPYEGYVGFEAGHALPEWIDDAWQIRMSSQHFMPDGSLRRASYTAWLAPANLERLELTLEEALAGRVEIRRRDDDKESDVAVTLRALDGGLLIEFPEITFSAPTFIIRSRPRGTSPGPTRDACPKRCGKGRVCRHGRCVRKDPRGRQHKGKGKRKGKGKTHRR